MQLDLKIVPTPWLIPAGIDFLIDFFSKNPNPKILEFGSGCSTAFFAKYLGDSGQLVTIEHNLAWYKQVQAYLNTSYVSHQVDLRLVTRDYYLECEKFLPNYFDLVFIDAKDRMACLKAAKSIVRPGGIVILDDSQMRAKYQQADQIMHDWPKFELVGYKSNPLELTQPEQFSAMAWWIKPF